MPCACTNMAYAVEMPPQTSVFTPRFLRRTARCNGGPGLRSHEDRFLNSPPSMSASNTVRATSKRGDTRVPATGIAIFSNATSAHQPAHGVPIQPCRQRHSVSMDYTRSYSAIFPCGPMQENRLVLHHATPCAEADCIVQLPWPHRALPGRPLPWPPAQHRR